jgi:hypothetical protein
MPVGIDRGSPSGSTRLPRGERQEVVDRAGDSAHRCSLRSIQPSPRRREPFFRVTGRHHQCLPSQTSASEGEA